MKRCRGRKNGKIWERKEEKIEKYRPNKREFVVDDSGLFLFLYIVRCGIVLKDNLSIKGN